MRQRPSIDPSDTYYPWNHETKSTLTFRFSFPSRSESFLLYCSADFRETEDMSRMIRLPLLCASAVACVLVSCAPRWTEAQRASLSTLAVSPSLAPNAYSAPRGSDNAQAPVVVAGGGGFASGAAVGAGAQLGVEIVSAVQQKMFASRYADSIAKAPDTVPSDLSLRLGKGVSRKLGTHPFFQGKLRENSSNRLKVIVENYHYARAGKADGEILMTPLLTGRFELVNANGEQLLTQRFFGVSPHHQRPLPEFVRDKKLASAAFDEAIDVIALQAYQAVDAKLRP